MSRASRLLQGLARVHRTLGLGAAIFIIWLATSGITLNHGAQFGLDRHYVQSIWMLDFYGVQAASPTVSYAVGQQWLSQVENDLYLGSRRVTALDGRLLGAVGFGQVVVAVSTARVLLISEQGELLEAFGPEHGLPAALEGVGVRHDQLVIRHRGGAERLDPDSLQRSSMAATGVIWAQPGALPEKTARELQTAVRQHSISCDRLLRDLHSGRFFGSGGRLLVDLTGVILIILTVSGIWIWYRVRREFHRKKTSARQRIDI